jgi:hypothetical protein
MIRCSGRSVATVAAFCFFSLTLQFTCLIFDEYMMSCVLIWFVQLERRLWFGEVSYNSCQNRVVVDKGKGKPVLVITFAYAHARTVWQCATPYMAISVLFCTCGFSMVSEARGLLEQSCSGRDLTNCQFAIPLVSSCLTRSHSCVSWYQFY